MTRVFHHRVALAAGLVLITFAGPVRADEPAGAVELASLPEISAEEPLAAEFSLDRAATHLDASAVDWTRNRKCFTCHTNLSYLMARPGIEHEGPAYAEVRTALEALVEQRWEEVGPRNDATVVMGAAVLAVGDAATTGKLHATTRKAMQRMWQLQRDDGGWDWLKCNWPPFEIDDHYGVTMAAIGVGAAPDQYAQTPEAKKGLEKMRRYLAEHPAENLHQRAMVLWASRYVEGLITSSERSALASELLALQKPDGGWNLATIGGWERADGSEQDTETSDGYATGFVVYVLRHAGGVAADNPQIQKGIAWLKANQRASGRWYTRSQNRDNKHFISNAGTSFAVLALTACGETLSTGSGSPTE